MSFFEALSAKSCSHYLKDLSDAVVKGKFVGALNLRYLHQGTWGNASTSDVFLTSLIVGGT